MQPITSISAVSRRSWIFWHDEHRPGRRVFIHPAQRLRSTGERTRFLPKTAKPQPGPALMAGQAGEASRDTASARGPRPLDPIGETRRPVYLVRHDWHTGIVVRRARTCRRQPGRRGEDFPDAESIWSRLGRPGLLSVKGSGAWLTLKAAFWPTPSVLHFAGFKLARGRLLSAQRGD